MAVLSIFLVGNTSEIPMGSMEVCAHFSALVAVLPDPQMPSLAMGQDLGPEATRNGWFRGVQSTWGCLPLRQSRKGPGEPGLDQQGLGEGSSEGFGRLWSRAGPGSRRFRRRFQRRPGRLWCGFQVRLGSGKGSEEGLGGSGAEPHRQQVSKFGRRSGSLSCRVRSGADVGSESSGEGLGETGLGQRGFGKGSGRGSGAQPGANQA